MEKQYGKDKTYLFEAEGLYVHRASKIETEDGKNVLDIIRNGRVNFVINTVSNKKNISADGFLIRRVSADVCSAIETTENIISLNSL